jgi:CDP-diacylglycerol--glycerol-3-phosphate 3-phosphatidyltransferase
MNLPTKITLLRLLLIPVFIFVFLFNFAYAPFAAAFIFALASLTDFLDGYIARKYNLISDLGKFLDPIADKLLVLAALVLFIEVNIAGAYFDAFYMSVMTIIILSRELIVSAFRMVAASKSVVLAADNLGKIKTNFQFAAILVLILTLPNAAYELPETLYKWLIIGGFALMAAATVLTILSGANYLIKNKNVFKENE